MAIYHMSVKIHSRSKGESAAACAAYRAGERIYDEELQKFCDFRKKKEVVYKEIMLCRNAPAEYQDRGTLWNSVMKVEKSKDAQFAREFEIALPREADRESQIKIHLQGISAGQPSERKHKDLVRVAAITERVFTGWKLFP